MASVLLTVNQPCSLTKNNPKLASDRPTDQQLDQETQVTSKLPPIRPIRVGLRPRMGITRINELRISNSELRTFLAAITTKLPEN